MKSSFLRGAGFWLAALLLASVEARAANGVSVSRSQETLVTTGMIASEVRQLLGRPMQDVRYRNATGRIWTYDVIDPLFGRTQFDIEFGPDERVLSTLERVIGGTCGL